MACPLVAIAGEDHARIVPTSLPAAAGDYRFRLTAGVAQLLDIEPERPDKPPARIFLMSSAELAKTIDSAFDRREEVGPATKGAVREAVEQALDLLDRGAARVAERASDGTWRVNQWLKKAVLLSFRLNDMSEIAGGPGHAQ